MTSSDIDTFEVIICGCGPTGALLSANLGRLGVKHVVLEREADITTDPRGIALDEEGIRILQGVGIYDKLYTDVGKRKLPALCSTATRNLAPGVIRRIVLTKGLTAMGFFRFIEGKGDLHTTPFIQFDYNTVGGHYESTHLESQSADSNLS